MKAAAAGADTRGYSVNVHPDGLGEWGKVKMGGFTKAGEKLADQKRA